MDNQRNLRLGTPDKLIRNAAALDALHGYDWNRLAQVITGNLRTPLEDL